MTIFVAHVFKHLWELSQEAVARWFFQQLVIGADYCHKRGVANRDIKLENTLLQVRAFRVSALGGGIQNLWS